MASALPPSFRSARVPVAPPGFCVALLLFKGAADESCKTPLGLRLKRWPEGQRQGESPDPTQNQFVPFYPAM
jgi:hypothetical protein